MPYIGNVITSFAVETGNINDQAVTAPKLSATGGTNGQVLGLDAGGNLVWTSDPAGQWVTSGSNIYYDTGNVGIGTTSPASLLSVDGVGAFGLGSASAPSISFNGDLNTGIYSPGADQLALSTNGTGRLFVDSSGRLLVGTSSTSATSTAHFVGRSDSTTNPPVVRLDRNQATPANAAGLGVLAFGTTSDTGMNRGAQIQAVRDGGTWTANTSLPTRLEFSTAADGSASPTERLRITSAGLVGIGTSSPLVPLHVNGAIRSTYAGDGSDFIGWGSGSLSNKYAYIAATNEGSQDVGLSFNVTTNAGSSNIEAIRIDDEGNVGIGTTSPVGNLTVNLGSTDKNISFSGVQGEVGGVPALVAHTNAGALASMGFRGVDLRFATGSSERARIDSSGRLLVGNTNPSNSSDPGIKLRGDSASSVDVVINAASNINLNHVYNVNATNNGYRYYLSADGGIRNFSSNNSNLCDEREKKNIAALEDKWDKVKSWEIKKFHYIGEPDTNDLRYGVIAQQVETECPEVLTSWLKQEAREAQLDEDGNVVTPAQEQILRKGVKEQQMMWMAIKALQEAQDRIETLEQRLSDAGIA